MDVAGRREAVDVAGSIRAAARLDQALVLLVQSEELLVLDALDDAEHAPRHVVVEGRQLPGPPDERHDREGSVGLGVEHMASIAVGITAALFGGEDVCRREPALELGGHQHRRLLPVGAPSNDVTDSCDELVHL
jgi:hypothetical protein